MGYVPVLAQTDRPQDDAGRDIGAVGPQGGLAAVSPPVRPQIRCVAL